MTNPVTAANIVSGERSFETVSFPVTGDDELDAISAILAILEAKRIAADSAVRMMKYLALRYEPIAEQTRRPTAGMIGIGQPAYPGLTSPTQPNYTPPWWTTSGGTGPYQTCELPSIKDLVQKTTAPPASAP